MQIKKKGVGCYDLVNKIEMFIPIKFKTLYLGNIKIINIEKMVILHNILVFTAYDILFIYLFIFSF